ncbi:MULTISPECIES: sigma-70 family RNA polymerase sigma factor [Isoptericola]|uniref:Sigma-70 family RNA polymerase sigma factor n=1 Tax=Isoptericola sediminis TaxID=2733572 RepID=A0A849K4G8_9MICO|nr:MULTISPECIES: sigma-70 family RNA polymerase sigma factor [unclassified Isoptericola]MDO8145789.1 sigma-70 family RNA polymerase sigma factor [Isoptericola sp. 178]MDO8149869.1 sigma-70 family RNA polymerase sigma factor [Isoptericola sp. b408]NNU26685.1 sigma-70 family RNA polymerase sigma factor [Isoptericola sediminis]
MATDDQLLTAIHTEHAADLHRYVTRLVRDPGEAQDVVQEALLRLWRHPDVLERPEESVRAWLFTVARHLVVDQARSARRRRERTTDQVPEIPEPDATQAVLDAWLVADALSGLSADHRAVVVGAYYGGRTVAELAVEHGVPPGTVKSRLHYALRALRLALQERGVTS